MRILHLCNKAPYPAHDGGTLAISNMAIGLTMLGNEISIFAVNTNKHNTSIADIPDELLNKITFSFAYIDTRITYKNALFNLLFSREPYIAERYHSNDFRTKLITYLKHNEFDVIQLEGPYLAYYIEDIRNYSKAKISYRAHNIEHEIWERKAHSEKNIFRKIYYFILAKRIKRFEKKFSTQYDMLVPITQRDLEKLNSMGNRKPACVIPFGVDFDKLPSEINRVSEHNLFYLGSLDWIPNQEGLIWFIDKIWHSFSAKYPHIKFHVAGRNAPDYIIRILKQNDIIYHGEIDSSVDFMRMFSIMIAPIFSGSGMRVKIVEGMALGKAIITTSIGAEGINATHGKEIIIADTVNDFQSYLSQLIDQPNYYDSVVTNAFNFANTHFDNKKMIQKLQNFYLQNL